MTTTPEGPDPWESERRRLVAGEIRAWMGRRRVSQAALAESIGRSEMHVSRALRGIRPFSMDDLFKIADALRVPADVLLHIERGDAPTRRHLSLTARRAEAARRHHGKLQPYVVRSTASQQRAA